MAEDFRRTSSKTLLPSNREGSTSFMLFNESEGQDVSKSEERHAVTNDDNNCISGKSREGSARICSTPEEESIPASVKELLDLLVNRAAQNQSEGLLTKEESQLRDGSGKVHLQDVSWTSSMATPSKCNSTAIEANDSTLVNFKFETSDIDVPEDKVVISHATYVNIPIDESVRKQSNCILSRKDDLDSVSVSVANNPFLEPEPILSRNSKHVDDLSTVNSGQEEQNIDCPSAIDFPDNSFLEDGINISVADDCADLGTSFLMSTPVKERSNVKISFNLRKYSFASVSLPFENDVDDKSVHGENLEGNHSLKSKKDMSKLSQNDSSVENLDIFDNNSQSLLKNITPVISSYPNSQEIACKVSAGDFLQEVVTNETSFTVAQKNSDFLNSPTEKIHKKACSPISFDTEPVSKSVHSENGLSEKSVCSKDLTGEMSTVLICSSKADVQRDLFESSHCPSMESVMTVAGGTRSSVSDEVSSKNTIPACNVEDILVPANEDRAVVDLKICCDQNTLCASKSELVVLMDDNRSMSLRTCEKDMSSIHNGKENARQVIEDDIFSDYYHTNAESASCSTESVKTVITCYNRSTDNVHCASPISVVEGELLPAEGRSQQKSDSEHFLCCTDLMQTVPVNDANNMSVVIQDQCTDLKSIFFAENKINSSEQNEAVIMDDCCLSVKDIECSSRKLPADLENREIEVGVINTPIEMFTPIGNFKGEEDGMECVITDKNNKEDKCKSGINDDKGQSNVVREDINKVSCSPSKLQQVCSSKDQIIKPQVVNSVEREDLTHGNDAFHLKLSGGLNAEQESNLKNLKLSEGSPFTNLGKTECDAKLEIGDGVHNDFVYKDVISPCMPANIISGVDGFQKEEVETNNEIGKSPKLGRASLREENSHSSNFCEVYTDKELKVSGKSHHSTQRDKNEMNHKSDPKSPKEELMEYELNSSIMDNFFSETMDFECDKIAMQTQACVIQNPLQNSGDIFCEAKGQSETSAVRDSASSHDAVMKTETQDFYTSPSQDFLPSSVLEEVCQATEALVYHSKSENGCQLDSGMENELQNSDLENFEGDELTGVERKVENDEGMTYSESNVTYCSKVQTLVSKSPGNTTVTKTEPNNEEECIAEKEKSKKNFKKKILFTASECIISDEEIEVEIRAENEVKANEQDKKSKKAQDGSFIVKMKQIPECKIEDNSVVTKEKETSEVRLSPAKAFIYPRRGKKISCLIKGTVHVEDLMASAVALEKCSTFFPKSKSSEIQKLKNESLVCFNSLETSLNEITNQNADDNSVYSKPMDAGDQCDQFKRQTSNAEQNFGINQLNDDNGDISFLLAAAKNEEMFKPEVCALNNLENDITKISTIETVTESFHNKSAQVCASTLSENETIKCSTKEVYLDSIICKSGQNLEISELETKGIDPELRNTESKDEQCTSPILKKRISSRRNFRRGCKIQNTTSTPHNETKMEKSEDIPYISGRRNVNFPEENVSLSLREKKEESHSMNPIEEAGLGPKNNVSNVTKNGEKGSSSKLPVFNTEEEEDLFYEGDSIFMSSNLEFAIANEGKILVPESVSVQSKSLCVKEGCNSGKANQYLHKTEKKALGKRSETECIQENILKHNPTPFSSSDPYCRNVLHEKFIPRDDSSTAVTSKTAECKSAIGNMDSISGKLSPKGHKILSGDFFSALSHSVINDGDISKEAILESVSKEVQQTKSVHKDTFFHEEKNTNELFFSASGKKVSVSEDAIRKAEKMYTEEAIKELDGIFTEVENKVLTLKENSTLECMIKSEDVSELRKVKTVSLSVSGSKKDLFSKKSLSVSKTSIIDDDRPRKEFVEFSTASGKKVSVSEKALMNAQKFFSEESISISGEHSTSIDHEKDSLIHKRQANKGSSMCTSGRISKEELIQARELFCEEITSAVQNFHRDLTTIENFASSGDLDRPGFATASGKVSFSKKPLMHAQKLLSEETKCAMQEFQKEDLTNENVTPVRNTVQYGFSTGSGKRVAISKRALMNAQKMFSEVNDSTIQDLQRNETVIKNLTPTRSIDGFEFSTVSAEKVSVSKRALLHVQNPSSEGIKTGNQSLLKDEANNDYVLNSRKIDGIGFSTGSGEKIAVSEKALMQAQKLYSDVSDSPTAKIVKDQVANEVITPCRSTDRHEFSSANADNAPLSKRSMLLPQKLTSTATSSTIQEISKTQVSNDNILPSERIAEIGVSTTISEKIIEPRNTMMRVHELLSEETKPVIEKFHLNEMTDENVAVSGSTGGFRFSTGSGKKIAVSQKSLLKAKNLYSEIGDSAAKDFQRDRQFSENITPASRGVGYGFCTGSGRKVTVSKEAMMRAQKLFSDISGSNEKELPSDQTSNENATPARSTGACEFSTGSGRKVTVSKEAMMRAQKLFSDISGSNEKELPSDQTSNENATPARSTGACEFSTGSGRKVTVSKEAMMRAQKLFSDVSGSYEKDLLSDQTIIENVTPAGSAVECGFSTGSGSKVTVSKKAMMRAQKFFSDVSGSEEKELPSDKLTYENVTPARNVGGFGFSTGSGKRITVSKKALEQAQKIFSEEQDSAMKDLQKDVLTNENAISVTNEFGFSMASGKKVTVSKKALLQAHKLYSEVSDSAMQDLPKKITSNENETIATAGFGFSTASGKKATVSEKSLMQAKSVFLEDSNPKSNVSECLGNKMASTSCSEKRSVLSEVKCFEDNHHVLQNSVKTNNRDRIILEASSGSEKRFASPAKSLSLAKKACLEGSNSVSFEFSTAGGKEAPISEKALICSKKLLDEECNSVLGNLLSKHKSEIDEDVQSNETPIDSEQASSECCLHQRGTTKSPIFSKTSSRKSLSMARKLFAEDSLSVTPDYSNQETALAKKFVDSPDIVRKSVSLNMPVDGATPLSAKSVIISKNFKKNSILIENKSIIQKLDIGEKASVLGSAKFKLDVDSKNLSSASKNKKGKMSTLNETFSTPCDESQGDNYIKAVDLALLDSSSSVEYPTSPVLKRTNRRRPRFKPVPSSQITGNESISVTSNVSISSTNSNVPINSLSEKSIQLPCPIIHKDESNFREKEIDLWGTDLAEESWLGRQLDLAEASNQLVTTSLKGDIWIAARKRQAEVISSKKNVRPIVGKHLQERRRGPLLRSSLKDLVMGKRPGRYSKEELRKFNVRESTLKVTAKNAAEYQFFLKDHYGENIKPSGVTVEDGIVLVPNSTGKFGAAEAQAALLAAPGVDPSLLPPGGWCQNHFRWIVWKLACSERSFPEELGGRYFTPENVMRQLKYRWDREIDGGERPALRKILEMDDIASKRIVLCISSIEKPGNIQSSKKLELDLISSSTKLELTDGWYAIRGIIDTDMSALIQKGKLSIGTKIITSGAELVNGPSNGCHPLEPPAAKAAIRLNTNSTRRARWDIKLGYVCNNPGPLPVSLGSLLPAGGTVSALRNVLLARVYPILNVEKTPDGRKVVRSQKAEARVAAKFERQRQMWLENIYSQVTAEIQKENEEEAKLTRQSKRSRSEKTTSNHNSKRPKRNLAVEIKGSGFSGTPSPEDLLKLIEESEDASSFQSLLTSSQLKLVMDYKQEERERQQRELEERVRQRIKEEEEKGSTPGKSNSSVASSGISGGNIKRDVVTVLKARLVDANQPVLSKSAVLTIWRPSEEVISLLAKEGVTLNLYTLLSNGMRSSFLQLSSTRQTRYKVNTHTACKMDRYPSLQRVILSRAFDDYISQKVSKPGSASDCMPPFGEVDLVAMVVKIGDEPEKGKGVGYQNIFVAGSDGSLLSLAFWGGITEFALDDVLVPGVTIAAINLQWRRHHGLAPLPTVHAVETSNFSQHPGEERLKIALKKFEGELKEEMQLIANKISSKSDFLKYCEERLAAVTGLGSKRDISPQVLATPNISTKLDLSVNSPTERIIPMRPSVATRMKKLQMYEGAAEISLPVCHVKASPSAMKTFQPPARCIPPKLSKTDNQACELTHSDSSPMSLDSDF